MRNKLIVLLMLVLASIAACAAESGPVAATNPPPAPPTTAPTPTEPPPVTATLAPADAPSAANADVLFVKARQSADGTWRFDVTVTHPDIGWDDYADGWDVVLPDGSVVKPRPDDPFTRLLLHPHETEQPFTRSQSGITLPPNVTTVTVRAHDLVDGWGGQTVTVDLRQSAGDKFEVVK